MRKTIFKITLSIIIILVTIATGCKKEEPIAPALPSYYIRFKVDGVQKEFTSTTAYFFGTSQCALNGGTNDSTGNGFTINLNAIAPIGANTMYKENDKIPAPNSYTPTCYLSFAINSRAYYNYSSWIAEPNDRNVYRSTVSILALDSNHVTGTFSGQVRARFGSAFLNISDGEFDVERY